MPFLGMAEKAFFCYSLGPMKNSAKLGSTGLLELVTTPYRTAAATITHSPPIRKLAASTTVNAVGNGLFATVSILYYTQHLGFGIEFVSLVLAGATLVAIGGDLLSGRLSDRSSPKPLLLSGLLLSAIASVVLLAVDGAASFVVALCLVGLGQGLCMSSTTALIRRVAREDPALARASLRSLLTIGLSLGALLAGFVLAAGSPQMFRLAILGNAITFLIAALLLAGISLPPAPQGMPGRPTLILPDRRFAVFALANGVIGTYLHVLTYAVPLWMFLHHPHLTWVAGALVAANSLLGATFQVLASAGIDSVRSAGRRLVVGAACIAVSYVFFVSGWQGSDAVLVLVLVLFLLAHTAGEVLYSAGTMELLFRMSPEHLQGQYGAFYGISNGVMASAAPAVLAVAVASTNGWGWWVLAGATLVLALIIRSISAGGGSRIPDQGTGAASPGA